MKTKSILSYVIVGLTLLFSTNATSQSCDTLRNYGHLDPDSYVALSIPALGSFGGHLNLSDGVDTYNFTEYADRYTVSSATEVTGVRLAIWKLNNNSGNGALTLKVYNDNAGIPGTVVGSQTVSYSDMNALQINTLHFDNPVPVNGNFWVGYEISYAAPVDTFALFTFAGSITGTGTTWMNAASLSGTGMFDGWDNANQWVNYQGVGLEAHMYMDVLLTNGTPPELGDVYLNDVACQGTTFDISVQNSTGTIDGYSWILTTDPYVDAASILDEIHTTLPQASIQANHPPGPYRIYIFAEGACNEDGGFIEVEIQPNMTATVTTTNATCGEDNGEISFTSPSGGTAPYVYTFNGGTTWGTNSSITGVAPGTYMVATKPVAEDACPYVETITITGGTATSDAVVTTQPASCSADGTATITNYSASHSYAFSPTGPTVGNGGVISGLTAGTEYSVVVSENGCDSDATLFEVQPQLTADDASFQYASSTICLGDGNVTPTISGVLGGTFSVTTGTGLVVDPSTGEIDMTTSVAGSYVVTYTTNGTCPNSSTQSISITDNPDATFTYSLSEFCEGETGTISPTFGSGSSAGTFTSGAGLSIDASTGEIDLSQSTAGVYTITNTIVASGACPESTATYSITVNPTPQVDAGTYGLLCDLDDVIPLVGTPAGGNFSGTGVSNNEFDPAVAGEGIHEVTYSYSDANGCTAEASAMIEVEVCDNSGINTELLGQLFIAPNPASDYINVQLKGNNSIIAIQLVSIEGKVISNVSEIDGNIAKVNVSTVSNGTYLVHVSTEKGLIVKKIIVQ